MARRLRDSTVKPSPDTYQSWLTDTFRVRFPMEANYYNTMTRYLSDAFQNSVVWKNIVANLQTINDSYVVEKKEVRLLDPIAPPIVSKPFSSFIEKSFRINILNNPNFPNPPQAGWCLPDNWYSTIRDIVRTTLVVRYLDGVEYLANSIQQIADSHGTKVDRDLEARMEGYYAGHISIPVQATVPSRDNSTTVILTFMQKSRLRRTSKRL